MSFLESEEPFPDQTTGFGPAASQSRRGRPVGSAGRCASKASERSEAPTGCGANATVDL